MVFEFFYKVFEKNSKKIRKTKKIRKIEKYSKNEKKSKNEKYSKIEKYSKKKRYGFDWFLLFGGKKSGFEIFE